MSATVDIRTRIEKDIVAIPVQAVTIRPDSIIKKVYPDFKTKDLKKKQSECVFRIKSDNTVELVPITTGIQDDQWIHIKSGISLNDKVVIGPFNLLNKNLKHGDKIKIIK